MIWPASLNSVHMSGSAQCIVANVKGGNRSFAAIARALPRKRKRCHSTTETPIARSAPSAKGCSAKEADFAKVCNTISDTKDLKHEFI